MKRSPGTWRAPTDGRGGGHAPSRARASDRTQLVREPTRRELRQTSGDLHVRDEASLPALPGRTTPRCRNTLADHARVPEQYGFSRVKKAMFLTVSQTRINYRESALSAGAAGEVHGGDRLPWAGEVGADNFAPLATLDWQIHIYGAASDPIRDAARATGIALHEFAWTERAEEAGLERDALYLVRPDGYVALADAHQDAVALRAHIAKFDIAARAAGA